MSIPCVENTTFTLTDPYSVVPFKKVFICLPESDSSNRTISERVNDISEKLMRFYHNKATCDVSFIAFNLVKGESPSIDLLVKALDTITNSELVILAVGWSNCLYCTTIHRILDDYKEIDYMYEWELDFPTSLQELTKRH